MITGVDVSSWQPEGFPLVLDGSPVDFAIIKVTEGEDYTNPKWKAQRDFARSRGLSVGYYHFIRPGDIVKQSDDFLATAQPAPGEHLWVDWEDAAVSCDQKDDFIHLVKEAAPQYRVGLYCNRHFWLNLDTTSFAGDALWIAHHAVPASYPDIESQWAIHQYSTEGGIDHNVARFADRQAMKDWASALIVEPVDPVMAELAAIRAELAAIRAIMDLEPAAGDVGRACADELARRLKP